jgi:hypothetical protein
MHKPKAPPARNHPGWPGPLCAVLLVSLLAGCLPSGSSSEEGYGMAEHAIAAPVNVRAIPGDKRVDLDWDDSTDPAFSYFAVRRSTQPDTNSGTWTRLPGNQVVSQVTDTDAALVNGTTYYYYVTAIDTVGNVSERSAVVSATPNLPSTGAPAAPTGLTATGGDRRVSLDWADNTETDLAYYAVRRSTQPDTNSGTWTRLPGNYTQSAVTDTDTALVNGTTYYYYVTAIDTAGNVSARSSVVSATPRGTGGTVLWSADYATKGLSAYTTVIHPERISIVNDPILGTARKVARLTVYDTDTGPTENPRAQMEGPYILEEGREFWVGWSTLFPSDWPAQLPCGVGAWLTFVSTYGPPHAGAGPAKFGQVGCSANVDFNRNETYNYDLPWSTPVVRNRWMDFVVHQKMSQDPAVGFMEIYLNTGSGWQQQTFANGQKRLYYKTMDSSNNGGPNNHRLSLYRMKGMYSVMTLYHADHRIGTSFDAVAPTSYR